MHTKKITKLGALELTNKLTTNVLCVDDVVNAHTKKIKKCKNLNAWANTNDDYVQRQIKKIKTFDKSTCKLWGVPIGIKDTINTYDYPTQMGSPIWKGFCAGNDARIVHYLRKNGAIIMGKNTSAEFAVHFEHTPAINPHDKKRITGTSTSGGAVAVATNQVPIAIGTQTAGSITRPASYNGVWGFKPTYGAIPRIGVLKTTDTLDTVGFILKDPKDLKTLFDTCRVSGPNYEYAHKHYDNYTCNKKQKIKIANITHPYSHLVSPKVQNAYDSWLKGFKNCSHVELTNVDVSELTNKIHDSHEKIYCKSLSYYFKNEAKKEEKLSGIFRSMLAKGKQISTKEYQKELKYQEKMILHVEKFFKDFDFLLMPSVADIAPLIGQKEPKDSNLIWTYLHMPTISMPFLSVEKMPVGILCASKRYNDYELIEFVNKLNKHRQG